MFRRNSPVNGLQTNEATQQNTHAEQLPLQAPGRPVVSQQPAQPMAARQPAAMPSHMATAAAPAAKAGELPVSRFGGIPGVLPRRVGGQPEAAQGGINTDAPGLRKLIVGKEISLSGDITACDVLQVEGFISATMPDGKHLEISHDGHFKGSAEVDEADIAGKFEGSLTVRGRVKLRSTGQIMGTLSYGEIEVEAGGRLVGELKVLQSTSSKKMFAEDGATKKEVELAGAEG
jgi:cytoskeletal protein CcmA (bactofilin family)